METNSPVLETTTAAPLTTSTTTTAIDNPIINVTQQAPESPQPDAPRDVPAAVPQSEAVGSPAPAITAALRENEVHHEAPSSSVKQPESSSAQKREYHRNCGHRGNSYRSCRTCRICLSQIQIMHGTGLNYRNQLHRITYNLFLTTIDDSIAATLKLPAAVGALPTYTVSVDSLPKGS